MKGLDNFKPEFLRNRERPVNQFKQLPDPTAAKVKGINVRLSIPDHSRLRRQALASEITISEWARNVILAALEESERD